MTGQYACVKGGVVTNVIMLGVGDADTTEELMGDYDAVVRICMLQVKPRLGWTYDGADFAAATVARPDDAAAGPLP